MTSEVRQTALFEQRVPESEAPAITSEHSGYAFAKRLLDILVSALLFVALLPLFALIAIAIKIDSGGPTLYVHRRVGKDRKHFTCYKFRSMHPDAALIRERLRHLDHFGGSAFKAKRDPRITRVGRIIRRTSIDELPQLLNVLRGDISLVGPRPLATEDYESRHEHCDAFTAGLVDSRLRVKPGITGLWQVSGRSDLDFETWMLLDEEYIRRRSFWFDLWLLVRTVPAVLLMRGAM